MSKKDRFVLEKICLETRRTQATRSKAVKSTSSKVVKLREDSIVCTVCMYEIAPPTRGVRRGHEERALITKTEQERRKFVRGGKEAISHEHTSNLQLCDETMMI